MLLAGSVWHYQGVLQDHQHQPCAQQHRLLRCVLVWRNRHTLPARYDTPQSDCPLLTLCRKTMCLQCVLRAMSRPPRSAPASCAREPVCVWGPPGALPTVLQYACETYKFSAPSPRCLLTIITRGHAPANLLCTHVHAPSFPARVPSPCSLKGGYYSPGNDNKCSACYAETYLAQPFSSSRATACPPCPTGTTTKGATGQRQCSECVSDGM
jgi:hypothetical protein